MGKVYHLNDLEEFFGADEWKLQINVADIWNKYQKQQLTTEEFNNNYYNRIIEYKTDITNLGSDVWTNLEQLIPKLKENITEQEQLVSLYDDIYDWADKHDILIKTK